MYRCYFCKEPVSVKGHMDIQKKFGEFYQEDDGDVDDDCFDNKDAIVVCRNCIKDVEIEIES